MNLLKIISRPSRLSLYIAKLLNKKLSDKTYLSLMYFGIFGKKLNWVNPKTFNEKIQWLKLYNRDPLYASLVDKYLVKEYVRQLIGKEHVIPTLGVWNSVDEIDFNSLPEAFVLKTTHDGGGRGVYICYDKSNIDKDVIRKKLQQSLNVDPTLISREWVYKDVKRRIIAEPLLRSTLENDLPDYKFFVFNGKVEFMYIASERYLGKEVRFDFFDKDFKHLDVRQIHPMSHHSFSKPDKFNEMKSMAEILCKGIPFVRCDLYNVDGHLYFGEFTFFHHGGFVPFYPEKWDRIFGDLILLPKKVRV